MTDTTPDIQEQYTNMILSLSPGERVAMACRMFGTVKSLMYAGMKDQIPVYADINELMFNKLYGRDFSAAERKKIIAHLKKKVTK